MKLPFAWNPYEPPPPDGPISDFGWGSQNPFLVQTITDTTQLVIEIGSFHGASARFFAKALPPEGKVICVDTFCGDHEMWLNCFDLLNVRRGRAEFYEIFLRTNIAAKLHHKIFPLVMDSQSASKYLRKIRFPKADLIYIDGSHDYDSVRFDIKYWRANLKTDGWMVFDDYEREAVWKAVAKSDPKEIYVSKCGSKARFQPNSR